MFDDVLIKRKPAVKLVGYIFDEEMTWGAMIDGMVKKARKWLGTLTDSYMHGIDVCLVYTANYGIWIDAMDFFFMGGAMPLGIG